MSGNLAAALSRWLHGYRRLVVAGVGNILKTDDGLGVEVIRRLGPLSEKVLTVDCGTVPESYLGPIVKFGPSHVLIVDAADIASNPGAMRLVLPEEISGLGLSTHALPLSVFADYLKNRIGADVALLAIQPKTIDFGGTLSPEVRETIDWLCSLIRNLLK
jgi:hydrogenase 3 maturation protease